MHLGGAGRSAGRTRERAGLTASLAGAATGAGLAFAITKLGLEERFGSPQAATAARTPSGRFDIEKVKRARAKGELESAFQMLRAETRRNARNRDVVLLFWEIAVEHDQAEAAAPAMLQLIREELRRGAVDAAVAQWRRVGERVPGALLEPPLLLKLLPLIRSKLGDDAAVLALHQAADPANRGFSPEVGAQIAREAATLEPEVAVKVAKRTLAAKSITPELASELNALVTQLEPRGADDEMGALPAVPSISFDDDDEHDRSDFGAVDDLSADPEAKPARRPRRLRPPAGCTRRRACRDAGRRRARAAPSRTDRSAGRGRAGGGSPPDRGGRSAARAARSRRAAAGRPSRSRTSRRRRASRACASRTRRRSRSKRMRS